MTASSYRIVNRKRNFAYFTHTLPTKHLELLTTTQFKMIYSSTLISSLAFGLCIIAVHGCTDSRPLIKTSTGNFLGETVHLGSNFPYEVHRFLGIPYAQPPIGLNRFEKPQPLVNKSDLITIADQFKPTCIQLPHFAKAINPLLDVDSYHNISEDCLYLNIYKPATSNGPLPVMVWLPGEGFDFSDARQFNGAYLASIGQVIVITVQYRVGVFGFLKDNLGIWDQLAALDWIQQNAANFGGNHNQVTLFGRFSGSMSISILLSSPQVIQRVNPLFNRAILMSGIAVGNWVFDNNHENKVHQLMRETSCTSLDCLRSLPADKLLAKSGFGWKPMIDSVLIDEEPLVALRKGKFSRHVRDVMLGSNQFEGNLCLLKHLVVDGQFYEKLISNQVSTSEYAKAVREDLEMFYGGEVHKSQDQHDGMITDRAMYVQFCSELLINSHMREYNTLLHKLSAKSSSWLGQVYTYKLDYKPSFSIAPNFINSSIHGDDVILAFGLPFKANSQTTTNDQRISREMIKIFSNFATFGFPYGAKITSDGSFDILFEPNEWMPTIDILVYVVCSLAILILFCFLIKFIVQLLLLPNVDCIKHLLTKRSQPLY